jgi:Fe-S-cluster containining protein
MSNKLDHIEGKRMANERMQIPVSESSPQEEALAEKIRVVQEAAVGEVLVHDPSPDRIQIVIEDAVNFAEALTQKHRDPLSPPVACAEGCSYCCYQQVGVSAPEVFRIIRFLSGESMCNDRPRIIERLRQLDKITRGLNIKGRAGIKKACAFLDGNRCLIYPVRPLTCTEFTSYDVQACKRGKRLGFKPYGSIHENARMVVFYAVQRGLADGLKVALPKADTSWLEMTAAVVTALDTPNAELAWLGGSTLFSKTRLAPKKN